MPNIIRTGPDVEEITWARRLRWIGLAAVPSSLMLGVTVYMSTDISAIPLFWVLPLALYLLSFILVFMRSPINWLEDAHEYVLYAQPVLLVLLAVCVALSGVTGVVYMIAIMLLAFFVTALACHGEMAKDLPSAKYLTELQKVYVFGFPFGLTMGGVNLPMPAKITAQVLEPIDVRARFGSNADRDEVYDHLSTVMQDTLDRLAGERRWPIIG